MARLSFTHGPNGLYTSYLYSDVEGLYCPRSTSTYVKLSLCYTYTASYTQTGQYTNNTVTAEDVYPHDCTQLTLIEKVLMKIAFAMNTINIQYKFP